MSRLQLSTDKYYFHPDFEELLDFFGEKFALDFTLRSPASTARMDRDAGQYTSDEDFNRRTTLFGYHNIINMLQGVHRKYLALLFQLTADCGPVSILEVGPGGGQLGLALHTFGFKVAFAEMVSVSALFLAWRLRRRRLDLPLYLIDNVEIDIPFHNVVIAFDVVEHIKTHVAQAEFLHKMAEWGSLVMTNLLFNDPLPGVHHDVDVERLTGHLRRSMPGRVWSGDYYPDAEGNPRQRLVIYGTGVEVVDDSLKVNVGTKEADDG